MQSQFKQNSACVAYLVKNWDVLVGRSLGRCQEQPQHEALCEFLLSRRELSVSEM